MTTGPVSVAAEVRRLWLGGATEKAIAARVGCSRQAVNRWRRKLRLPSRRPNARLGVSRDKDIRRLWLAGLEIKAIARRLGVSGSFVMRRRRRLRLPSRRRPLVEVARRAAEVYAAGKRTGGQVAAALGVCRSYALKCLRAAGLKPSGHTPETIRQLLANAARTLGYNPALCVWQRQRRDALLAGWPAGATAAQAAALGAVEAAGGADTVAVAAALGVTKKTAWERLSSCRAEGWVAAVSRRCQSHTRLWRLSPAVAAGRARWRAAQEEREAG